MMPLIETEVMLLDWSETAKGGAKIVLQLPSPEELAPFKSMTLAKRGVAGQRFMAVFAEVNEQEEPAHPSHRGAGPLCQLAARWCRDPRFQEWAGVHFPVALPPRPLTQEECRALILDACKIASRRELDTVPSAAGAFHEIFRVPFMEWAVVRAAAETEIADLGEEETNA